MDIDRDKFFGHYYNNGELLSAFSVKELALNNRDILAAAIIDNALYEIKFHSFGDIDPYIRASARQFAIFNDNTMMIHWGDCIKKSGPCTLCICECSYMDGLNNLSDFK